MDNDSLGVRDVQRVTVRDGQRKKKKNQIESSRGCCVDAFKNRVATTFIQLLHLKFSSSSLLCLMLVYISIHYRELTLEGNIVLFTLLHEFNICITFQIISIYGIH